MINLSEKEKSLLLIAKVSSSKREMNDTTKGFEKALWSQGMK